VSPPAGLFWPGGDSRPRSRRGPRSSRLLPIRPAFPEVTRLPRRRSLSSRPARSRSEAGASASPDTDGRSSARGPGGAALRIDLGRGLAATRRARARIDSTRATILAPRATILALAAAPGAPSHESGLRRSAPLKVRPWRVTSGGGPRGVGDKTTLGAGTYHAYMCKIVASLATLALTTGLALTTPLADTDGGYQPWRYYHSNYYWWYQRDDHRPALTPRPHHRPQLRRRHRRHPLNPSTLLATLRSAGWSSR
jgi:hypothetical protein